jgi:hypothetical protein
LSSIENVWLRRLALCQCGWITFPSRWQLNDKVISSMECHVFLIPVNAITVTATFDLWMSWRGFDTFVLAVNYINKKWEPCHVTVGIFKVHETLGVAMVVQFDDLLAWYNLLDKIIAYVKDKGANLNTFVMALTNILSCVPFLLP